MKQLYAKLPALVLTLVVGLIASSTAFGSATIVIENGDAANVGFNDPTPVSPVGNNSGTTLGQQRLNAFQFAANIWGATLTSGPTITIHATWEALTCSPTSGALGSAGNFQDVWRNFAGGVPGTWYGSALRNAFTNTDGNGVKPEIIARFNVNLGTPGCLDSLHWYYGLDTNSGTNGVNLVTVLIHEFAHGLGFQTFTDGNTGVQLAGFPTIYDRFLFDNTMGKNWPQMTDAERKASAINPGNVIWNGPQVTSDLPAVLASTPRLRVNSPSAIAGKYLVATAQFGGALTTAGITAGVVIALGDTVDPDGCSALTNAAAVSGKIALIDRGTCTFVAKAKNAQNAGAIGVIIANNVPGSPPGMPGTDPTITIPVVSISQADGEKIKTRLGSAVNVSLLLDSPEATMYTPNPFTGGSSVSHWDTSLTPNQLMEPNITSDLTNSVVPPQDLTSSMMKDIGWLVTKTDQTISFPPLSDKTFGDAPFSVSATASSGLPVSLSILSGPATISGNMVTITGSGTITVRASQPGNGSFNPAPTVDRSFVAKSNQSITFDALPNRTFGNADFPVSATASSGLIVSFAATGNCTVTGNTVQLSGAGACTITAKQAGNANYNAATSVDHSFIIAKATPVITWNNPADITYGTALGNTQLNATTPVTGTFGYTPAAATVLSAGSNQMLSASFTPNDAANYNSTSKNVSINVLKANQTITFGALGARTFNDADFTVSATASSSLAVSFSALGDCTVSGSTVQITGGGACTITASQAGNANYKAAADVPQTFHIAKANQTITFGALAAKTFGNADFPVSATASSNLSVSFAASGQCTVTGNIVQLSGAGACTITASQAGNGNYNAAIAVNQSFIVSKANQTITFNALANKIFGDAPFSVNASSSSGLAVGFSIVSGPATISGNTISLTGAGVVTVRASQTGDANYNAAASVERSFTVEVGTFQSTVLAASQVELKNWTFQGRTYAYLKLLFPNAGYRVTIWGQAAKVGNNFTADAAVEKFSGASVQAVTTTAQIYDLGPLANGTYNFNFKTSGTLAKTLQFTISSTVPPPNPIDTAREFVKQQYRDFLNREADQAGEDFWTDNIAKCSDPARRPAGQTEAQCILRQRETTSGAFFLSPEFQYTGYFVYRMYQGALGRQPKLSEFLPDAQFVGNGIVVNGQLSGAVINQNKAAFAAQFVNCTDATKYRCAEFKAIYDGLNNQQYVDKLFLTTGVNASPSDRTALVSGLDGGSETRASVLQKVVDGINVIAEGNQQFTTTYGQAFYNNEFNRAFVELEYFGYMKRDPDDAGYGFWLGKLNSFNGSFVNAEMVLAFISSPEYRARFGQP